jgi:exodeoxyribonuclease VII small subunit
MPNTPAPVTPNEASFESVLQRLQAVVSELESGDLPLEQALTERLDKAEARIDELLGKEGFRSLEPPDLRDGNPQRTTKETR